MPRLIVNDLQNQRVRQVRIKNAKFIIGKLEENDLPLMGAGVSKQHCVLFEHEERYYLRDLGSSNGTFVNGEKIAADVPVDDGTSILVGSFELTFRSDRAEGGAPGAEGEALKDLQQAVGVATGNAAVDGHSAGSGPAAPEAPAGEGRVGKIGDAVPLELRRKIHQQLMADKKLKLMDFTKMTDQEARNRTKDVVLDILKGIKKEIPRGVSQQRLIQEVLDEALGLGPLEDLIADKAVNEIMVNRFDRIYVERAGKGMQLTDLTFIDNDQVTAVIQRIIAPIGRRINESSPLVDARLRDGSRVNAVIAPLAVSGPSLTIRKFPEKRLGVADLVKFGSITDKMGKFLEVSVLEHKNIVISGGTGSGKTTLLNVISSFIPGTERIVTIEDVAELQLPQEHVVRLETKPPNLEGEGAIEIRDLVKNSLRMRPDRIVVGECRGGEALDMLQAMNTGHDGSLTTLHANTPLDALRRMETMVLMAGMDLPSAAIRQQIAGAVHMIVQQTRLRDGSRKVTWIAEIGALDEGDFTIKEIYRFHQKGLDKAGKIIGDAVPTGHIPAFIHDMRKRGLEVDMTMFGTEV